jgi:cytoskeletal protein RodZ
VFDKAYLKIYANLLKIDALSLLALYERQRNGSAGAPSPAPLA